MRHILTYIISLVLLLSTYTVAFTTPSSYIATSADTQLVQSITPQIDSIFDTDYARGSRIMLALESIGTRFDTGSREYYILRQLYLHMDTHTNIPVVTAPVVVPAPNTQ